MDNKNLYSFSALSRQLTLSLVLFTLLFNSIVSITAASFVAKQAQQYADDDAILICGGSTYSWVSLSHFEATGEFKSIDPPADAPEESHSVKCVNAYLADLSTDELVFLVSNLTNLIKISGETFSFESFFTTDKNYLLPSSRAPPFPA